MKKLKCDLCDHVAEGETFEEWMNGLKPHYAEAHAEVMQSKKGIPEEMKAEMPSFRHIQRRSSLSPCHRV